VHIGIPMCTNLVSLFAKQAKQGIPMCTQHQWLSLLCRPEDDRLMGRNV